MKAVILARVSTLKQEKEGLSLKDIQLPELRDYAVKKDFEVVKEFVFSELLRATMRKNEKSIGQNKRQSTRKLRSYNLPMRNTM